MKKIGDGNVEIGTKSRVSDSCQIIFNGKGTVKIGRYVTIGDNVKIILSGGDIEIGDWTTIHADSLLMSESGLWIKRHCWFGQNTILDGTGGLTIEDGVRVGMYSQIWSHVAAGEQIEGCTLFAKQPTKVERDAWLVGSCTVSSGTTIGERAVCMNGSNITKSIPANTTAMGVPARVREGLSFYDPPTLEWKFEKLVYWASEFAIARNYKLERDDNRFDIISADDRISILKTAVDFASCRQTAPSETGLFCVENKSYRASFNQLEEEFIRWLSSNKARFYPEN